MKILYNAVIHTLDSSCPAASAIVINDHAPLAGQIVAIGESDRLLDMYGLVAEKEDLGGAVVLPGLTDSHIHLQLYADFLQAVHMFGCDKQTCLDLVAERAANTPPGEWIIGYGWSQDFWGGEFPTAADLDAVVPDHPVLLNGVSLHVQWVNSAAMRAVGVHQGTPNPVKGQIGRDEHGNPNGLFFEDAMKVFDQVQLSPTHPDNLNQFQKAQEQLWQIGLTGVHDFDRIPSFISLQTLHRDGNLKLRVLKNLPVESLDTIVQSGLRSGFGDDLLRIGSIKAFADGALGSRTAAMLAPYDDDPTNTGMLLLDAEDLVEFGEKAVSNGLRLTVHAIGDGANHEMLNGFEQLRQFERAHHLPHLRHRLEHVQIIHPDDLDRLAELDLIASMQPIHATSDMDMAETGWGERARLSYAWNSIAQTGARLAFGSDAPVDSPNPFHGLHAAVTRQRANGYPNEDGWYPEERLSLIDALKAYTLGAAYTAGMEDRLGMLAPGYLADLILLDVDPFTCTPDQLREIQPHGTMIGGDWVFRE